MNGTGGNTDLQDAIPSPTLGQLAILFGSSTSSLYGVYIYCGNMGWHSI